MKNILLHFASFAALRGKYFSIFFSFHFKFFIFNFSLSASGIFVKKNKHGNRIILQFPNLYTFKRNHIAMIL